MRTHLLPDDKVENFTQYAFVDKSDSKCVLQQVSKEKNDTTFSLLGNLFVCEGKPGRLIKLKAQRRIGNLDFASSIQKTLSDAYKDDLVGRSNKTVERLPFAEIKYIVLKSTIKYLRFRWRVHSKKREGKAARDAGLFKHSIDE